MDSLDFLCSDSLNISNEITKNQNLERTYKNILWPIKNISKYFMTHQPMFKTFYSSCKNPPPSCPK